MAQVIDLGPLTRVEGHLDIQVTLDQVNGSLAVVDAKSSGTMFRGFEKILHGRAARDATHLTARICGVCPISHATASALALEAIAKIAVPGNGRIERNLILGSNFVSSHVLHFYHLAIPDYVDVASSLNMSPWTPRFLTPDMLTGSDATSLVDHYVQALAIRRQAHQMGALFGGRQPCSPSIVAGGCTNSVTSAQVTQFQGLLTTIQQFINNVYLPDVAALSGRFSQYSSIGAGCGNLLAFGVFDLDGAGATKLLQRGRWVSGGSGTVDTTQIREFTKYSYYTAADTNKVMTAGATNPNATKAGAYSWIKAPRYVGKPYEVGPLARMWINGDYRKGPSVMDRLTARAMEAKKVADAMATWVGQLTAGGTSYTQPTIHAGSGVGLTEAPRGALGHWVKTGSGGNIGTYQILTPTAWNASPMDDTGVKGPIEQALIGTPVADATQPIEVLRVVHSFDPCLSCAVHMARPGREAKVTVVA